MSYSESVNLLSFLASADLSAAADQYKAVKLVNVSGVAQLALAGDGEDAIGTLYEGAASGLVCAVASNHRIAKIRAGGNITSAARIASGSDGRATVVGSGDRSLGIALESAVAGDVISYLQAPIGLS